MMRFLSICVFFLALAYSGSAYGFDVIRKLDLTVNDLAYDSARQVLYASVPAGSGRAHALYVLDPKNGNLLSTLPMEGEPGDLAMTPDGRSLYVGLRTGLVQRLNLDTKAVDLSFPLGVDPYSPQDNPDPLYAEEIEVAPGSPDTLAVSRLRNRYFPAIAGVAVYDRGVQREKTTRDHIGPNRIEFGKDAAVLYGYDNQSTQHGFYQLAADAAGVTIQGYKWDLISGFDVDIRYVDGLVYTSGGLIIDPERMRVLHRLDVPEGAVLLPDPEFNRLYFLAGEGPTRRLKAFDLRTRIPLGGEVQIPGVTGEIHSPVRWGDDGVAFRTTAGQVILVDPFHGTSKESPADLSVTQTVSPSPARVGAPLTLTLQVTNHGPSEGSGVLLAAALPPEVAYVSSSLEGGHTEYKEGWIGYKEGRVTAFHEGLRKGDSFTMRISVIPHAAGFLSHTVALGGYGYDPLPENNTHTLEAEVHLADTPDSLAPVLQETRDLIYDPHRGTLYASVPSNARRHADSLITLDPRTGRVEAAAHVGGNPGKLALSGDGRYLYALVEGETAVQRYDLTERKADLRFDLGMKDSQFSLVGTDIEVLANHPEAVAVPFHDRAGMKVYVNGIPLPKGLEFYETPEFITPSDSPDLLYGFSSSNYHTFQRLKVDENGVTALDGARDLISASNDNHIKHEAGLLYTAGGLILDPEKRSVEGKLPYVQGPSIVEPEAEKDRVYFLSGGRSIRRLLAYDRRAGVRVGALDIPGVSGAATSLIRWSEDGLAFRTDEKVFILRTGLIPSSGADLAVSQTAAPAPAALERPLVYTVTVRNKGETDAHGVTLVSAWTDGADFASVTSSQGNASFKGPSQTDYVPGSLPGNPLFDRLGESYPVVAELGTLPKGAAATMTVTLTPTLAGALTHTVRVAGLQTDPHPPDNVASLTTGIRTEVGVESPVGLNLHVREMIYDPTRGRIYASLSGTDPQFPERVAVLDPTSGLIEAAIDAGRSPGILALTEGGRYLYVVVENGTVVKRIDMETRAPDLQFSPPAVPGSQTPQAVMGLAALPGRPESVAVSSSFSGVMVFDNGVPRPQAGILPIQDLAMGDMSLAFGADASRLYVTHPFVRMAVGEEGVSIREGGKGFPGGPGAAYHDGRIFTPWGPVFDPELLRITGRFTGIPQGERLMALDGPRRRAYFLRKWEHTGGALNPYAVTAFDTTSYTKAGEWRIPELLRSPGELTVWGEDGLAFTDREYRYGRLYLARTSLAPAGGRTADISVAFTGGEAAAEPGGSFTYVASVRNGGPDDAAGAALSFALPKGAEYVSTDPGRGTVERSGDDVIVRWGPLAFGEAVTAAFTVRAARSGSYSGVASVTGTAYDPRTTDNTAWRMVRVESPSMPLSAVALSLSATDLIYDPRRKKLYAGIAGSEGPHGNSVVGIDPETGGVDRPIYVGSDPGRLALSDDGRYLYVHLYGGGAVRRVDLDMGEAGLLFPLATGGESLLPIVTDMEGIPGRPGSLAVNSDAKGIVLYDEGVPRPFSSPPISLWTFEFASPALIYGLAWGGSGTGGLAALDVTGEGIVRQPRPPAAVNIDSHDMKLAEGRLYFNSGEVLRAETWESVGAFPSKPWWELEPDPGRGRAYTLEPGAGQYHYLRTFDAETFRLLSLFKIPNDSRSDSPYLSDLSNSALRFTELIRWGEDGLAFNMNRKIHLVRILWMPGPGDLDRNGAVDVSDVVLLLQLVTGLKESIPDQLSSGDVAPVPGIEGLDYGDNLLDVNDAVRILQAIVGRESLP